MQSQRIEIRFDSKNGGTGLPIEAAVCNSAMASSLAFGGSVIMDKRHLQMNANPTKDPEFRRVLNNLLKTPPKPHSEMKLGKRIGKTGAGPKRKTKRRESA